MFIILSIKQATIGRQVADFHYSGQAPTGFTLPRPCRALGNLASRLESIRKITKHFPVEASLFAAHSSHKPQSVRLHCR